MPRPAFRYRATSPLLISLLVAGCAAPTPKPTALPAPTQMTAPTDGPTREPTQAATPAIAPTEPGQAITITTADGVGLPARQYGAGETAVIFATTSDSHQDVWTDTAQEVAQAGYLTLTFDFRFWGTNNRRDSALMNAADSDLLAAVDYARAQGVNRVVVMGASLGGLAAAKIAAQAQLDGLVVIGAPMSDPALTIAVTPEELAGATMPKLFIISERDATVSPERTQTMFDLAADPKELLTFATNAHATDLLASPFAADLEAALLDFLKTNN